MIVISSTIMEWTPNEGHVQNGLVVSTPLKNSQLGWLFPIYGKTCSKPPTRKVIRDHLRKLKGFRLQTDDDLTSEPPAAWMTPTLGEQKHDTHTLNMISQYDHAIKWQRISTYHLTICRFQSGPAILHEDQKDQADTQWQFWIHGA